MEKKNKHIYLILFGLSLTNFLASFDVNAINLALVRIQQELSLSLLATEWVMSGFLLSFASLMIVSGRISDIVGHKRLLLSGMLLFIVSSAFAGSSKSGSEIIIWRIAQGAATACFWPATQSIVYLIFPEDKKIGALGILLAVAGVALGLGPVISGIILSFFDWRWIFFINIPICLFSYVIIYFCYEDQIEKKDLQPIDYQGVFYLVVFSFGFIYSITLLGQKIVPFLEVIASFFIALLFLFIYYHHAKKKLNPIICLDLLKNKELLKSVALRSVLMFSFMTILFLTGYYLQHFLLYAPWISGLYFLPITLFFALGSFTGSKIASRVQVVKMIYIGGILAIAGMFLLGLISPNYMKLAWLSLPMALFGVGFGTVSPLNNYYTMKTVSSSTVGFAVSFSYMLGLIFSSVSIALSGIFITKLGGYYFFDQIEKLGLKLTPSMQENALEILSGAKKLSTLPPYAELLTKTFFFSYQINIFTCAFVLALSFLLIRLKEKQNIDYNS
ncbi:MAG: MFS transporter [Chlamydiae bacterium]|nr:MFS transporter [Chlamydiota bacterium]